MEGFLSPYGISYGIMAVGEGRGGRGGEGEREGGEGRGRGREGGEAPPPNLQILPQSPSTSLPILTSLLTASESISETMEFLGEHALPPDPLYNMLLPPK